MLLIIESGEQLKGQAMTELSPALLLYRALRQLSVIRISV